jgi:hypothetical protein
MQRVVDTRSHCVAIDIVPLQRKQLALTQYRGDRDSVERLEAVSRDDINEVAYLLGREWIGRPSQWGWWVNQGCDDSGN